MELDPDMLIGPEEAQYKVPCGSCRISDSRAETKGGVAYSHVVPRPLIPLMRKAAPTH